jgi:protein-tyrosine kinase
MSRIHEALKKAQQEHAANKTSGTISLPPDPPTAVSTHENSKLTLAASIFAPSGSIAPSPNNYLRFDDLRKNCAHPQWQIDPNLSVFFNPETPSHGAERFRTLRTRLYQLRGTSDRPLRTLVVTSSLPAEGKTFVAQNLAQAIVRQPDRRVLLIDADLRCARLHLSLGAPNTPGLTDYLRGEIDETSLVQCSQEGNLCFIPGGREVTDPSELLSNGRLKTLLDRVTPVFDWIILDSPPALPVADASVLAGLCDGVLLVVRAGKTPSATVQKACQDLHGANIVGVVLNAMEKVPGYASYYNYGGSGQPASS